MSISATPLSDGAAFEVDDGINYDTRSPNWGQRRKRRVVPLETAQQLERELSSLRSASGKLEDSEQYRMQMAGISTAALGYWKEGDEIHPDYDTPALRDVAKLYAKYAELFEAARHAVKDKS